MRKLWLVLIFLAAAVGVWASGSQQKQSSSPSTSGPASFAGKTLNVMFMQSGENTEISDLLPAFEKKYNVKVNLVKLPHTSYDAKAQTALIPSKGSWDVVWVPWRDFPTWMAAGWFENLNPYIQNSKLTDPSELDLKGFAQPALHALQIQGKQMALPILMDGVILAYRTDILQNAGLSVPDTWSQLQQAAAKVNTSKVAGYAMRTSRKPGQIGWMVPMLLKAWGGGIVKDFPKNMQPNLTSPENMAASKWYVDTMTHYTYPGGQSADWLANVTAFGQGQVAMMAVAYANANFLANSNKSTVSGKTGYAIVPRGPARRVGSGAVHGLGIPANAQNKDLAWVFIQWILSNKAQMENLTKNGSTVVTRPAIMRSQAFASQFPGSSGKQLSEVGAQTFAKYADPLVRPMNPEWPQVGQAFSIAYSSVLSGQSDLKSALANADKRIAAIYKKAGLLP